MTVAEAERIVRELLRDRIGEPVLLADIPCQCAGCRDLRTYLAALDFLLAELARTYKVLRRIADGEADANHASHCLKWRRLARAAVEEQP